MVDKQASLFRHEDIITCLNGRFFNTDYHLFEIGDQQMQTDIILTMKFVWGIGTTEFDRMIRDRMTRRFELNKIMTLNGSRMQSTLG